MELLNGKAKLEFEKWVVRQTGFRKNSYTKKIVFMASVILEELPEIMVNALIIEWLDGVGIIIYNYCINDNISPIWSYSIKDKFESDFEFYSRQLATESAIKKANDYFNQTFTNNLKE